MVSVDALGVCTPRSEIWGLCRGLFWRRHRFRLRGCVGSSVVTPKDKPPSSLRSGTLRKVKHLKSSSLSPKTFFLSLF